MGFLFAIDLILVDRCSLIDFSRREPMDYLVASIFSSVHYLRISMQSKKKEQIVTLVT